MAAAIWMGSAVALPASAGAAAEIGHERIVVSGDGARAVITRAPFRLELQDGAGTTVLSQVANDRAAPMPVPPAADPKTLGLDGARRPTLYAPLTFTVGARAAQQDPATIYNGNQLIGTEAGVQHSARDVVGARPEGEGVRLVVSTSDPTGRELVVTVVPGPGRSMRIAARPTPDTGVQVMGDSFTTGPDEAFRGFGGRHNAIDQRGQDFYNWSEQENFDAGGFQPLFGATPGAGGATYQFPNGPTAAYYPQALFVSSRPYGFLLERPELSFFRLASDREDAWQVSAAAPALDYLVAPGDAKQAIATLTQVNGRHRQPPDWALGAQDSENIEAEDFVQTERTEQRLREDLAQIDRQGLRYSAFDLFGWFFLSREKQRAFFEQFKQRGIRPLVYFVGFFGADSAEGRELREKGYTSKTATGQPYVYPSLLGPSVLLDFTNPGAKAWWRAKLRDALDLGAEGWMEDFGEQVQSSMYFANGETGATMHNRYPSFYHQATREVVEEYEREHPGRRIWVYTRAGYSATIGQKGTAASEGGNFPGDNNTDFSRANGLASAAPDMLSRGIGGAYGYSTDIGGYQDSTSPTTTKELLLRWGQWAVLSPAMRIHNSLGGGTQHPWSFDADALEKYRALIDLRERAKPLVKRLWAQAEQSGIPIARPLWLEFPGDAQAAKQDQEWMLGPDVLVAPVVTEGATSRTVYFPSGDWVHPETGERFTGPRSVQYPAPIGRLPYFFRAGTRPFDADAVLGLPGGASPRRCRSRRAFSIRLRAPRGQRLVRALVQVNGRSVRVLRGRRLRAPVVLRGLPKGRYRVRIVARTARGATLVSSRTYRTCVPRERSSNGPSVSRRSASA